MKVAITGTPGTGKTSVCARLKGVQVADLRKIAGKNKEIFSYDKKRKTIDVDPKKLKRLLPRTDGTLVIEGHLSHLLDPDIIIVLRCSPSVLRRRLSKRRWSKRKIQENLEAEAVDVILIEALDTGKEVFEIDTTELSIARTAKAVMEIIDGERGKYGPGNIDWSGEVMDWY